MERPTEYASVTEAAKALAVSRVTIYKWIANRRLDAEEIAGRTVITVNANYREYNRVARQKQRERDASIDKETE